MDESGKDLAYVATADCGHVIAASVIRAEDSAADKRDQKRTVADWVTRGYRVETKPVSSVRSDVWCPSHCPTRARSASKSRPKLTSLPSAGPLEPDQGPETE
jgi:hypothetical protein